MSDRRRFLQMFGGTVVAVGVGCSSSTGGDETTTATSGTGGAGGAGSGGDGPGTGGQGSGTGGQAAGGTGGHTQASSSSSAVSSTSSTGTGCDEPPGTKVGMPDQFAANGLHQVPGSKVLIGHDAAGFYALSSICTHQSCNMNSKGTVSSAGIHCTCHGSQFNVQGGVVNGPAHTALKAYALAFGCDGSLVVDTSTTVASSVRLTAG